MTIDIATAAQLSCLLEVSAPKPGNVSPGRHFADTRYEHFLASAAAIGRPLAAAADRALGETILDAARATSQWTRSNTNLGIVLLLAPLARAAMAVSRSATPVTAASTRQDPPYASELRGALRHALAETTVADARNLYTAIRLASPGGLGESAEQDVASEPTVTLLRAMELAADYDGIAREYASGFALIFETGAPALLAARAEGMSWDDAIVEAFLKILAAAPDTHVARRGGPELAADISQRAAEVLRAGGVRSEEGRKALVYFDHSLRDPRNVGNPGTTADLTAAAIFVALLSGAWS